jgi:hypothetical protein
VTYSYELSLYTTGNSVRWGINEGDSFQPQESDPVGSGEAPTSAEAIAAMINCLVGRITSSDTAD